ncbi:hypothetical protein 2017DRC82_0085 [Vibrio phage ICP1]|nr:hypothetical protein 1992IndM4_0090 [Vibrio phage ICP1]QVV97419.1 hypothetical protein 2017DRC106_0085 [Vibrio phage ICP1]QVV97646.1 hypothetical protein 2017DRC32_0085 [Vibrio phage ICP1]QVV97873.1 hypothetical protein 2017DRC48_0085 [Vibrio phage ICP1]QVV98100.1 hypothetical protein 2017DRC55_0085 [Vibrio phage ICP1]
MKLTDKETEKVRLFIINNQELIKQLKCITLYKKNDAGLALFRLTARNNLQQVLIRMVLNKPLTKDLKSFISNWFYDGNTMIKDFTLECARVTKYNKLYLV